MTYIRLDDGWVEHPKVVALTDGAKVLYIAGLSYCSRRLTDGAIPAAALRAIGGTAKQARELLAAGLWEQGPAGYEVHDYTEHQRSRAEIEMERAKARQRWKRAKSSGEAPPDFDATSGEVPEKSPGSEVRGQRLPPPNGVGKPSAEPPSRARRRALTPEAIAALQADNPDVDVQAVADDYLNWTGSSKHSDKILGLRNQLRSPLIRERFRRPGGTGRAPVAIPSADELFGAAMAKSQRQEA